MAANHGKKSAMASKKIQVPDINGYSEFRPFLDDFFARNKESNKNFSFRFLAGKLGWSPSHLNDVMQGRRFLSLPKIMELIEFLGLKGVRAERLLLLALFESNGLSEKGKEFLALKNSSMNVTTMTHDEKKLMTSVRTQQVLHYIMANEGRWDIEDFLLRGRKASEMSRPELGEIIRILELHGLIKWDSEQAKYLIEKTEFYHDTAHTDVVFHTAQREFAKSYEDFLADRFPSWMDLIGNVLIPKDRLPEVYDRLVGVRNYLYEIRGQTLEKKPDAKFEVFQFSINLFSVFRRPENAT